jgi:hypothetical protein
VFLLATGLVVYVPQAECAGACYQHYDRDSQRHRETAPLVLLACLHLRLGLGDASLLQSILDRGKICGHSFGHLTGVARSVSRVRGQAGGRQLHKVWIGATGGETLERVTELRVPRLYPEILRIGSDIRRSTSEDCTEQGAQAEHVTAFTQGLHFTARLLGSHVGDCAQHLSNLCFFGHRFGLKNFRSLILARTTWS